MDRLRLDPRDQGPGEFMECARELAIAPQNARRLLALVIGKGECDLPQLAASSILPQRILTKMQPLPRLHLEKQQISGASGFRKLAFRTSDNLLIETVLIPLHKQGAFSVCLSSQIGCAMRCAYCITGRMPVHRNLLTWEIVDQFIQARAIVHHMGGRVTGAVFMGMGEPFLNYDRVLAAARLLCFPVASAIRADAITISTVGLVPQIVRFTEENHRFRLSVSLGAATDEKRSELMPVAAQTPIADVMEAARRYAASRNARVMLSYVCISGVNVSTEDAQALGDLIGDTPVRLDLIDVHDPAGRYMPPEADELNAFRDALRRYVRQPVVRRYSGGSDIGASCGSLGGAVNMGKGV